LNKSVDSRFGVIFGIVVLAAFVVVLAVSLATLGWSGPGEYRGVMVTLVASLLVTIVAGLAVAWVVANRMLLKADTRTGPSDEIPRIRGEMEVIRNTLESLGKKIEQADRESAARHKSDKGAQ
jgi:hypothetical protein